MTPFTDNLWIDTHPVRILGMRLTSTMTVIRLDDDELLIHSPVALTDERRTQVEELGTVVHLYAPSRYHETWTAEWTAAYPQAILHAPQALVKERPDLRIDRIIDQEPASPFEGVIEEISIDGLRLDETVLFHRPSQTLVVADLIHNVGQPEDPWTKFYTKTMGFYDQIALSKLIRWTAFSNRAAARGSIVELLERSISQIIVGHGNPVTIAPTEKLEQAFLWLL